MAGRFRPRDAGGATGRERGPMTESAGRLHIGVDVGGTFTDLVVTIGGENRTVLHKLPSTPERPDRAIIDGVRQVLAAEGLAAAEVSHLAHGTTVGTNALIQRRGGRVALVTSEGFRDLLEIGRQTRPKVYDIHLDHPKPLVERALRLEVPERRLADGTVHRALDEARLRELAGKSSSANGWTAWWSASSIPTPGRSTSGGPSRYFRPRFPTRSGSSRRLRCTRSFGSSNGSRPRC